MTRTHGSRELWMEGLRAESAAFLAAVSQPDVLAHQVPSCPEWTVEQLVCHLSGVYRWVRQILASGTADRPERTYSPDGPAGLPALEWWDQERTALLTTLAEVDSDRPTWNWAPQPKKAVFWHRRMAHETAVHRWDAQMATGLAGPLDARLATDGIAEFLDTYLASGLGTRAAADRVGVVALHATDVDQFWYVRVRPGGIAILDTDTLFDDADLHERAAADGTASDLLLSLYGRVPFGALTVAGDAPLLEGLRIG